MGELKHYGVKGMRWGVHRYQNKDGSLTKLGKKRIQEGARLFPKYKGKPLGYMSKRSVNRDTVADALIESREKLQLQEYKDYVFKHPKYAQKFESESNARDFWSANIRDKKRDAAIGKAYMEAFISRYGDATLRDLNIKITPQSREYVTESIRNNGSYKLFLHG